MRYEVEHPSFGKKRDQQMSKMALWCEQNVGQEDLDWVQIDTVTQFVSEEDATMFQMVWG